MDFCCQQQWVSDTVVRPYCYTHSQPQWSQVMKNPECPSEGSGDPPVTRAPPLAAPRRCASCSLPKQFCCCTECNVCRCAVGRGTRHHCRKCWRAVCSSCWVKFRYVHMLGRPTQVCDRCAVPWGLANLPKRHEKGLHWGLYLLRRAVEMPSMCVAPACQTLTYYSVCYVCGTATVATQPHLGRLVRVDTSRVEDLEKVRLLDAKAQSLRCLEVDAMTASEVHLTFRRCFPRYEEVLSFRGVLSALEAQDILLGIVTATVSYEYHSAPNLALTLSDVPYAKLLKLQCAKPRFSVFEAPGKVKFVAFPGTHNWRTRWVDLNYFSEPTQVWAPLVEGVRIDPDTGEPVLLCGGVRKVWEYTVHTGFSQEARDVGLPIEELIEDVRNGYRLVFGGHSLGGAVAQLLTVQMLSRYASDLLPPNADDYRVREAAEEDGGLGLDDAISSRRVGKILCVTLGTPPVGNYQFVDRIERSGWAGRFHNIVYRTDVVPRLSCSDELTWDATSQLVERAASFYRSIQSRFTGSRSAGVPAGVTGNCQTAADAACTGRAVVESLVDNTVRCGREVLEDAATAVLAKTGLGGEFGANAEGSNAGTATGRGADEEEEEDISSLLRAIHAGERRHAENRIHRRFGCFGRYHFLAFGKYGYVSTMDSELAFRILKRGCGESTVLLDHSVGSYNRGVMLHLYGKKP